MQYSLEEKTISTPQSIASFKLGLLKGMWKSGTIVGQREREREVQKDILGQTKMFGDIICLARDQGKGITRFPLIK